jgi:hypothetical protein
MSGNDEEQRIDPAILDAWTALEPPPGFADRVLAARRPRSNRGMWVGAVAGVAGVVLFFLASRVDEGVRQFDARGEQHLGSRAVAVGEAGASLRWRVEGNGAARVEQTAGNVFYRVERGGPFVVATAAGEVRVQGTCFRVEVNPMWSKQSMVAASLGAAAATTVLVSVYEGRVLLANEHGSTALVAGEAASARAGQAPSAAGDHAAARAATATPSSNDAVTRDELLARDQAQRAELAQLRARVQELQAGRPAADGAPAPKAAESSPFFAPTKDELAQFAKDCKLKWDMPPLNPQPSLFGPKQAERAGLTDGERAEANRVTAEVHTHTLAELRALFVEVTGDKAGAETLSPQALSSEILDKSPEAQMKEIFARLSRERAGLQAAPADTRGAPAAERLMRLMTTLGDKYERELGEAVGPDRAHALREQNNGWGSRNVSSNGCPE